MSKRRNGPKRNQLVVRTPPDGSIAVMGADSEGGASPEARPLDGSVNVGRRTTSALRAYSFSGPLPPPELLAKYNEVIPNGAERIMAMAEVQARHRQGLESTVVNGNVGSERRGQWMGLAICLVIVCGGMFLAHEGRQALGGGLVTADLIAL